MLRDADTNGDGRISRDEFVRINNGAMAVGPSRHTPTATAEEPRRSEGAVKTRLDKTSPALPPRTRSGASAFAVGMRRKVVKKEFVRILNGGMARLGSARHAVGIARRHVLVRMRSVSACLPLLTTFQRMPTASAEGWIEWEGMASGKGLGLGEARFSGALRSTQVLGLGRRHAPRY